MVALDGNDTIVAIRCKLTTDCDSMVIEKSYPVSMTSYMWKFEMYDFLPVISKYNGTLLMIDVDAVEEKIGWRPAAEDVQWYRQEGELDNLDFPNEADPKDVAMNVWGYYYTPTDLTGTYYAFMKYSKPLEAGICGMMARTLTVQGASGISLNPSVAAAGTTVTITGDGSYNVKVADMFNNIVGTYTGVSTFTAPATAGTYIVLIETAGQPVYLTLIVY
jgi:hypothetical protein